VYVLPLGITFDVSFRHLVIKADSRHLTCTKPASGEVHHADL